MDTCRKSEAQRKLLELRTLGRNVIFREKETGKQQMLGAVESEVSVLAADNTYKHFIQRIEYTNDWRKRINQKHHYRDKFGFRICYWTLDKTGKKLKFGQYASHMPESDFHKLLRKAINRWHIEPKLSRSTTRR